MQTSEIWKRIVNLLHKLSLVLCKLNSHHWIVERHEWDWFIIKCKRVWCQKQRKVYRHISQQPPLFMHFK